MDIWNWIRENSMGLVAMTSIIGTVIGIVTIIILRANPKRISLDRQTRSMEFIRNTSNQYNDYDNFQYEYRKEYKDDPNNGDIVNPKNLTPQDLDKINQFLNVLEQYGLGVKRGLYDIHIIAEYYDTVIIETGKFLSKYLKSIRKRPSDYSNYQFVYNKVKKIVEKKNHQKNS